MLTHPYAGTNRIRFKGFALVRVSGSASCGSTPWDGRNGTYCYLAVQGKGRPDYQGAGSGLYAKELWQQPGGGNSAGNPGQMRLPRSSGSKWRQPPQYAAVGEQCDGRQCNGQCALLQQGEGKEEAKIAKYQPTGTQVAGVAAAQQPGSKAAEHPAEQGYDQQIIEIGKADQGSQNEQRDAVGGNVGKAAVQQWRKQHANQPGKCPGPYSEGVEPMARHPVEPFDQPDHHYKQQQPGEPEGRLKGHRARYGLHQRIECVYDLLQGRFLFLALWRLAECPPR